MGWRKARGKQEKGEAIARFMREKFAVEVIVVDSLTDPDGIAVMRADGGLLTGEQGRALELFLRGYRVFGGPS